MASKKVVWLWVIQIILAIVFLFSGFSKLMMSDAALSAQVPLPLLFVRLLSIFEIVGALGLVLPGPLKMHPWLTPLAAACLAILMVGAVIVSLVIGLGLLALIPLVVGVLAVIVAWKRWH